MEKTPFDGQPDGATPLTTEDLEGLKPSWVSSQPVQLARRGRCRTAPCSLREDRQRAWPHGLSTPPHRGQASPPASSKRSTATASVSTINIGCPPSTKRRPSCSPKLGRVVAHFRGMVMPSTRTLEENRKVTSSYSVTPTYLPVVNHGVAQHPARWQHCSQLRRPCRGSTSLASAIPTSARRDGWRRRPSAGFPPTAHNTEIAQLRHAGVGDPD